MIDWFTSLGPVAQAAVAGSFTWLVTATGASLVFFTRSISRRFLDAMLGFAAGVMIAASFWSLLSPAIEIASHRGDTAWLPALVGFLSGGLFLRVADHTLPHLHPGLAPEEAEGPETSWRRSTLLVLAITLHNIPEGLAVGVAFGAVAASLDFAAATSLGAAIALSIGIGIQNFPEGIAVAMPLRSEGMSAPRAFWHGQLSAIVEPVAAVVGVVAVVWISALLPYALAFAAGAMIYVVVEELVPASHLGGYPDTATTASMAGFAVMMLLDVALG